MKTTPQQRILLVDDDAGILLLFSAVLAEDGFNVVTADSMTAALHQLDQPVRFDLILTDIRLGEQSGIDLLRQIRIRKLDGYVLLMTSYPDMDSIQEALHYGAFDYLTKPVTPEILLRQVHAALAHQRLRDEKENYRRHLEAIFRSVQDAILTVDPQRCLHQYNEAARLLCDLRDTMVGQPLPEQGSACLVACREIVAQLFNDHRPVRNHSIQCVDASQSRRMLSIAASPLLDEMSAFAGAVVVIRDDTRLATLERDLRQRRQFHGMIGKSHAMQQIYGLIETLADVESTVLIRGESGTGKELVAEALHHQGRRSRQPLVSVNCSALTDTLLESELFGHVRGSFTGAIHDRNGLFQMADGGTIFLDEIGDISSAMQMRLLRVLQKKEFQRVGDTKTIRVDVRVVAATHHDLRQQVQQGLFREDLYYRLKVVEIMIPPLRERREDIPLLIEAFIERFNQRFQRGRIIQAMTDQAMAVCLRYHWPGNIRELEHAIEHAFILCQGVVLDVPHLPVELAQAVVSRQQEKNVDKDQAGLHHRHRDERQHIVQILQQHGWVVTRAAHALGCSRSTLYRRMKELGIQ
ncbi:MAG: sigma 54-interacting transcriptional regulator [Magnetococcales bacterium]|nr:sigma 54-interacting transcriptional regulator [Magnetococcales bacterium]